MRKICALLLSFVLLWNWGRAEELDLFATPAPEGQAAPSAADDLAELSLSPCCPRRR